MTKKVRKAGRTSTEPRVPVVKLHAGATLPDVKGWPSSSDMMLDINRIHEKLQSPKVDPEVLRLMVSNMRNGVALLAIRMDFAKFTGRLNKGESRLPDFTF